MFNAETVSADYLHLCTQERGQGARAPSEKEGP